MARVAPSERFRTERRGTTRAPFAEQTFHSAFHRRVESRIYGRYEDSAPVSKTGDGDFLVRGFESLPLR